MQMVVEIVESSISKKLLGFMDRIKEVDKGFQKKIENDSSKGFNDPLFTSEVWSGMSLAIDIEYLV